MGDYYTILKCMTQDLIKKAGLSGSTPHSVSVLALFGSKKFTHYRNQIRSKVCLYNLHDINVASVDIVFLRKQNFNQNFNLIVDAARHTDQGQSISRKIRLKNVVQLTFSTTAHLLKMVES